MKTTHQPLIGLVMGSDSDWPVMQTAAAVLAEFGVPFEARVVSAHRTPDLLFDYAASAADRGLRAIIAGAGGAAHLPGMLAAKTIVPVLGVPVPSKHLQGLDSLLSIVQMPKGIPVATFAIGEAGAANAAYAAIAMLATTNTTLAEQLAAYRLSLNERVLEMKLPPGMNEPDITVIGAYFRDLQARITAALEAADGQPFRSDEWQRAEGGGGISRLIEDGHLFERGGVNFSQVTGLALPASATAHRPQLAGRRWQAMGVSLVLHPRNPYCPTVHMNVRFFIAEKEGQAPVWWFGGGMDLTPYYGFVEDAEHFHRTCRAALAPFGDGLHAEYKAWCDRYFFLKHRGEPRGIGGIFFDDVDAGGFDRCFALTQSVGEHFTAAYLPIIARRRHTSYGERERDFQAYRRGRYVEFNLVWDRGTLFGLQSGGRTESILMSLPPVVKWRYDWHPAPGSAEEKLYTDFLPPRDWI